VCVCVYVCVCMCVYVHGSGVRPLLNLLLQLWCVWL